MSKLKHLQIGYFLNINIWSEAKKLLDFQIAHKKSSKYYNTINFFYYDYIKGKTKALSTKKFFEDKVANNLFYGLENDFFYFKYTLPKDGIGLRKYFFFSYPMQVLYYSIGLYLLKVTQQFLRDNTKKNYYTFYGGNLNFENNNLNINKVSTTYYNSYNEFKNLIERELNSKENRFVVRLDIQNYYESISIFTLLSLIYDKVKL